MASSTTTPDRKELAQQFASFCEQHVPFLQHFLKDSTPSVAIEQINQWEIDTIKKIKKVAQNARENIETRFLESKQTLKNEFETLKFELEKDQESFDPDQWNKRLEQLKTDMKNLSDASSAQVKFETINWDKVVCTTSIQQANFAATSLLLPLSHPSEKIGSGIIYFQDTNVPHSTLLSLEHQQILNKFYGKAYQRWKLLYKATTTHKFSVKAFHGCCDNRGPTLIVIKERSHDGYLFGGFTPISWTSSMATYGDTYPDPSRSSFLFTLTNPHRLPPTKYEIKGITIKTGDDDDEKEIIADDEMIAVSHHEDFGPCFGAGDIDCCGDHNRISFPQSYIDTTGFGDKTFTGKSEFEIGEMEVFGLV